MSSEKLDLTNGAENAFDLLDTRISILKELIDYITSLKSNRSTITRSAIEQIDSEIEQFLQYHREVSPEGRFSDYVENRRIHIEKSIARLKELRRRHVRTEWSDLVILEKELLHLLSEYKILKALQYESVC